MTVAVCTENEKNDQGIKLFSYALDDHAELLGEGFHTLA